MNSLSKTDFAQYQACPEDFWLKKRRPSEYPATKVNEHALLLAEQGYEFEAIAQRLLKERLGAGFATQETIKAPGGLLSRADGLFSHPSGAVDLYEVKSGTKPKEYLDDLTFQLVAANRAGLVVNAAYLVTTNPEYSLDGALEPERLVVITDLTIKARSRAKELSPEIDAALALMARDTIEADHCSCMFKGHKRHCASFSYFSPGLSKPSIHHLPRVREKQLRDLHDAGAVEMGDLSHVDLKNPAHTKMLSSFEAQAPVINQEGIDEWLAGLVFPLSFLDYEAFASPVPVIQGSKPWQQVVTQYSLHVLHEDGELEHFDYLNDTSTPPDELSHRLKADLPESGDVISWNMVYENSRNNEIGLWLPHHAEFFADVVARTKDLMFIFDGAKSHPEGSYVDWRFMGSASIKNVLPILVPELSYDDLAVSNGTAAMAAWKRLLDMPLNDERAALRLDMLDYCRLDTLAMVKLYQFLTQL